MNITTNSFEIEILNMEDDTEMLAVQDALVAADICDNGEEEVGAYLRYGKPRSIFTHIGDVRTVVQILNGLGYKTDEDENR